MLDCAALNFFFDTQDGLKMIPAAAKERKRVDLKFIAVLVR